MKNKDEKVDKGVELSYWKLSYRRRFIREIYMTPFAVMMIVFLAKTSRYMESETRIIMLISISLIKLAELAYNYIRWKIEEKE